MKEFISQNVCSVRVFMHHFQLYLNRPLLLLDITDNAGITARFRLNNNNQKRQKEVNSLMSEVSKGSPLNHWVVCLLQADELEYTFKRLVDGLAHTREAARPGFSLALGQVSTGNYRTIWDWFEHQHISGWLAFMCVFEMCVKIISTPATTDTHFHNFQTPFSLHWLKEWTHIFI